MPLIRQQLPQTPTNVGAGGLGFAKQGLRELLADVPASDLRIGVRFTQSRARSLHEALRDAVENINRMPSTYMTYPTGGRILPVERSRLRPPPTMISIDTNYLKKFGWVHVPTHLWRAMRQNAAWIEPTLIDAWAQRMRDYAKSQGRQLAEEPIVAAMRWADPQRDVRVAREVALSTLERGGLRCVWTDRQLSRATLDIDLMFPWTVWPCSDLWNLLPSHREVNQKRKRDRLLSAATLFRAQISIIGWWREGYLDGTGTPLHEQFVQEARASLPALTTNAPEDVFDCVSLQRIRLRHDQQVPEWDDRS